MHWFPVLPPTVTDNFSCCKSCPYHWMVTKRMTQIYGSRSQKNRPKTAAPPAPPAGLAFQLTPFPPKKKITRQRRFSFVYGCVFKTHWIQSASKMLVIYIYIYICVCVCDSVCMFMFDHIGSISIKNVQRCLKMADPQLWVGGGFVVSCCDRPNVGLGTGTACDRPPCGYLS